MAVRTTCPTCGASLRPADRFCSSCGTPVAAEAERPPEPARTPHAPSLQVGAEPAASLAEQRKVVTVMFADLSGSTPLGETLDPEELRAIYQRYFAALSKQILRYEGTIDKYVGDAVMAVFGAPTSHEDDAERAIHAALAMQGAIASLNDDLVRQHGVRLALRIGVNTGEVVAGLLAGDVQHAYTVVGDTVNTAHRFESVAPLGEVVVSDSTRRLALHRFEFAALPAVALKGKRQPVVPYRVVRARDEEVAPESGRMVGRGREVETLRAALADALLGRGRVINVSGEAGVGKSRLVLEFRRDLVAGVPRLVARCASYETNTPYALLADLLRATFEIHASDEEPVARQNVTEGLARYGVDANDVVVTVVLDALGFGERSTLAPDLVRAVLVATTRELVAHGTAELPLVVVIEDLQWIDSASASVLKELVRDAAHLPILFVTTARPGTPLPWPAETLDLGPLDEDDTRALIRELGGSELADGVVARVAERTAGNPFFIEEVVHQIRSGGGDVPATVQDLVEARLDRLPVEPREVVDTGAIIGRSFWYGLLHRLLPSRPLADSLSTLEELAFITRRATQTELTYAFRQPILQEVTYQVQLVSVRRAAHGRVGAAIETLYGDRIDEFTDVLAYHYARSDDRANALLWLVRAGDRARSLFANDEALASYRAALELASDGTGPRDASTILDRMGDVEVLVGAYDDAIASYTAASERARTSDPVVGARLARKIGSAYRWKGDHEEALATLARARALLREVDDREIAAIALAAGWTHFHRGDYDAARKALLEGIEHGRRHDADDLLAEAQKLLGNVANNRGDLAEAIERYRTSLQMYERMGDVPGIADLHSNLGNMYRRMGRFDDAIAEHRASLAMRERIGHRWGVATCHNNIGEVYRSMGRSEDAIPELERARAIWSRIGASAAAGLARMNLGAARIESGDLERGHADLQEAERALDGTKFLPGLHRELARAELARGDLALAQSHADTALSLARAAKARQTEAQVQRVLAEIAAARGDDAGARALLEECHRTFSELGEHAELARTDAVLARVSAS